MCLPLSRIFFCCCGSIGRFLPFLSLTNLLYGNFVHKRPFESGGRASTSSSRTIHAVRHGHSAGVKRPVWKREEEDKRPG